MRSLLLITARGDRISRSQLDAIAFSRPQLDAIDLWSRGARSHFSTTAHTLPPIPDSRFPIPDSRFPILNSKF
ncbi:MAG: hypothetical protein F6J98_38915 [Moorea sp. SIO4G2]|nr:hypothetical protein [Moorena sp. SIO4G2]